MTRRTVIQGGQVSPMRVSSAAGGDAGSASPFNVIFDGNQSPLRYLTKSYIHCSGVPYGDGAPATMTRSGPCYTPPANPLQFPFFSVQEWRAPLVPNPSTSRTPYKSTASASGGGIGGSLANGIFYGIVFTKQVMVPNPNGAFLGPLPDHYICWLIFKNYG